MYSWVLPCIAIILICILIYYIYGLTGKNPEGFIIATPSQAYPIPELRGSQGRFVRIRPSRTHGDGYLSISQIQVIDINGNNVALDKPVFATSSGGSLIDQQYGAETPDGASYILTNGVSADPSCVTDGVIVPRRALTNIFETANQNYSPENTSAPDTEYLEIDLESNYIIKKIIYSGRANPIRASFQSFQGTDVIDQVSRLTNMRLEIRDTTGAIVLGGDGAEMLFSDNLATHLTIIELTTPLITLNKGSTASGTGATQVSIPDITGYTNFASAFTLYPTLNNLANKGLIDKVNLAYNPVKLTQSVNNIGYSFDVNTGIFSALVRDSPMNFYTDIYSVVCPTSTGTYCKVNDNCKDTSDIERCGNTLVDGDGVSAVSHEYDRPPAEGEPTPPVSQYGTGNGNNQAPPSADLPIQIFGNNVSAAAVTEMTNSINICKKLYLGSPEFIENYIRVQYDTNSANIKAYLRTDGSKLMCMPDIRQVFENGRYNTKLLTGSTPSKTAYQTWNETNCNKLLDATTLSLLPAPTRNFVIDWVYNRTIRYVHYKNQIANPNDDTALANADTVDFARVSKMTFTAAPIDITSGTVLNSLAQQFYELLGGQFSMSYIYDVFPLGQTMIDIRFDLIIHTDDAVAYGPIASLKSQYKKFRDSGANTFTQDIIDQAKLDYQDNLQELETDAIANVSNTFQGAVVRIFYTPGTPKPTVTGMIFDDRAVTSFVTRLNGGMIVPVGSLPGNVNFSTEITYTKNKQQDKLVCSDPDTVRRVMDDYMNAVQGDNKILLRQMNPIDTSKGALFVNEVNSYAQISPTHCAYEWVESLYDHNTNRPVPLGLNGSNRLISVNNANYVAEICGAETVKRFGIFGYKIDTENWGSPHLYYDISSTKFLPSNTIPACSFDPMTYKTSSGARFRSLGASSSDITTLKQDFITNGFKGGDAPVCPQTIPGYLFNAADYFATNGDVAAAGAGALSHYIAFGITEGRNVRGESRTTEFTSPIKYTKPLPAQTALDTSSGNCPVTYCDDLDVLYTLADQYNSNPSIPGSILRIKRAFTVNPYQCDIEAEINYDSMIPTIIGQQVINPSTGIPMMIYPMVKKGTVTYTQGSGSARTVTTEGSKSVPQTGVQTVKIALNVTVDKSDCSFLLVDAGDAESGASIRPNTPMLYKPMDYVAKLGQVGSSIGSSISQIQSDFSVVGSSAKNALLKYRANTYSAIGDINTLTVCPGAKCSDAGIMTSLRTMIMYDLTSTLFVGTADGRSCDLTYTNNANQTVAKRFTMVNSASGCVPSNHVSIIPTPTYNDIKNLGSSVNTANTYKVSGFTDYVAPVTEESGALREKSFGLDRARNSVDAYTEIQFQPPLQQALPEKVVTDAVTYRFLRFVPVKTRDPKAFSVRVNKFIFFYDGAPVAIEGKVTNPMGTWDGELKDVVGAGFRQGWVDDHKKPLVFAFKEPISLDGYSFTTSGESANDDPVAWRLEGSSNGSFWTILDTQQRFPTPVERFKEILPQAFILP